MDIPQLCYGCMERIGEENTCPYCGYAQNTNPVSLHHLHPGTILHDKYLIGKVLGQGGFGITYLAWDIRLDVKLAIKEYFPHGLVSRAPGTSLVDPVSGESKGQLEFGLKRFLSEAKTLAHFSEHPNIVTVRDYFEGNETAYMVMNYVEGVTLEQYVKQTSKPLSFQKTMQIIMPVLDALKAVHEAGILHRDISPDNIYIDTKGRVQLIDFGAARQELQQLSRSLSVIMKPGFSPIEQYQSKGKQGPWTDIYAVAATIYRVITNDMPPESLDRLTDDLLLPPSHYGIEIEESQEQALLKALSVRAENRHQNVSEFQQDILEDPVSEKMKPSAMQVSGLLQEEVTPDSITPPSVSLGEEKPKSLFSSKAFIIGAGAAAVLLIFAGLWNVIGGFGDSAENDTGTLNGEIESSIAENGEEQPLEEEPPEEDIPLTVGIPEGNQFIGCLFPLSGVLSTFGENSAEAAKLAEADINQLLREEGRNWSLSLIIEDTQTDGATGLRKMQELHNQGIKFIAGPQASGIAGECLAFANASQVLFISPSATSPALALPDDWFFRFCADDSSQGPSIAAVAQAAAVEHLIIGWRGDTWGDGMQKTVTSAAEEDGISTYTEGLRYDPSREVFTAEVARLDQRVTELVNRGIPLEQIGFNLIAFEEAASFLAEAAKYPQLINIIWIGTDGTALSEAILSNQTASQFAIDAKLISPMNRSYKMGESSKNEHVRQQLISTLGREPDAYSYYTYDIIWALALTIDRVGYDAVAVREALPQVVDEWSEIYGASGHIVLNDAGDRAFADYDYWLINRSRQWEDVGFFEGAKREINWKKNIF